MVPSKMRAFFEELHLAHRPWILNAKWLPPYANGMMWSIVSLHLRWQLLQRPRCFLQIARHSEEDRDP